MLKKFLKNTSANIAVTTAILIIPLLLSAGAAVDYSQLARKKTTLHNVIDSAALAVAREIQIESQQEIEDRVRDFIEVNLSTEQFNEINEITVTIPTAKQAVTVSVNSTHPTAFMHLAGIDTITYNPTSTVNAPTGNIEVMMVLDTTGSMDDDNKIEDLRASATTFVEDLLEFNTTPDKVNIGIVPFANYVNVGTNNRDAPWLNIIGNRNNWTGCVGSRTASRNLIDDDYTFRVPGVVLRENCTTPITELNNDEDTLKNSIAALTPANTTFIAPGLIWGQRALSSQEPFTNGSSAPRTQKIIVLMTDGDNTISVSPFDRRFHGRNIRRPLAQATREANLITERVCENIKSEGIRIFTIGFGNGISPTTLSLLQGCADDVDNYYAAADGAALNQAFADIGSAISGLFLSN